MLVKEAIYELNKQNPEKSEILIQGYGRLNLDTTKREAIKRLEEAIGFIREEDNPRAWRNAHHLIYSTGVVEAMLKAIIEANEELEDMQAKEIEGK